MVASKKNQTNTILHFFIAYFNNTLKDNSKFNKVSHLKM